MTVAVNPTQSGEPIFYLADEHPHPEGYSTSLGFWIYLMSDCLIFAMLFATFGVLGANYAAGPAPNRPGRSAAPRPRQSPLRSALPPRPR